jgi:hypothetical protein
MQVRGGNEMILDEVKAITPRRGPSPIRRAVAGVGPLGSARPLIAIGDYASKSCSSLPAPSPPPRRSLFPAPSDLFVCCVAVFFFPSSLVCLARRASAIAPSSHCSAREETRNPELPSQLPHADKTSLRWQSNSSRLASAAPSLAIAIPTARPSVCKHELSRCAFPEDKHPNAVSDKFRASTHSFASYYPLARPPHNRCTYTPF